jgi:trehalose-phosphatase
MPDGVSVDISLGAAESGALREAEDWAAGLGYPDKLERKPTGAAFHLRGLGPSESEALRGEAMKFLSGLASHSGFEIHEFDGGVEMRLSGRDKGDPVNTLLGELTAGTPAAYLGDDATDEDAFAAMPECGLGVLVRKEYRDTRADLWLTPPDELFWFLDRWLDAAMKG